MAALKPAQSGWLRSDPLARDVNGLRAKLTEVFTACNGLENSLSMVLKRLEEQNQELEKSRKVRDTLEKLCRELQAQNQRIAEASARAEEASAAHREQSTATFEKALDDIRSKIQESSIAEERIAQLEKALVAADERWRIGQEHNAKVLQTKQLELELTTARAEQALALQKQEVSQLVTKSALCDKLLKENEELATSFKTYTEQFTQLSELTKKSEQLNKGVKEELELQTKRREVLEGDKTSLMERLAKLELKSKEEAKVSREKIAKQNSQLDALKALCRELKARLDGSGTSESDAAPTGNEQQPS